MSWTCSGPSGRLHEWLGGVEIQTTSLKSKKSWYHHLRKLQPDCFWKYLKFSVLPMFTKHARNLLGISPGLQDLIKEPVLVQQNYGKDGNLLVQEDDVNWIQTSFICSCSYQNPSASHSSHVPHVFIEPGSFTVLHCHRPPLEEEEHR